VGRYRELTHSVYDLRGREFVIPYEPLKPTPKAMEDIPFADVLDAQSSILPL
jgi:hypothetical protein